MSVYALQVEKAVKDAIEWENAKYSGLENLKRCTASLADEWYLEGKRDYRTDRKLGDAINHMAECVAWCVIRELLNAGSTSESGAGGSKKAEYLLQMQSELKKSHAIENYSMVERDSVEVRLNRKGNFVKTVTDPERIKKAWRGLLDALALDGVELKEECVSYLWCEIDKHFERTPAEPMNWEKLYSYKKARKNVSHWMKDEKLGEKDLTEKWIKPIQRVFSKARNYIEKNGNGRVNVNDLSSYLEDVIGYDDEGREISVYEKLPKCCNLVGSVVDLNGGEYLYNVEDTSVEKVDAIIEKLELSKAEKAVLYKILEGDEDGYLLTRSKTAEKVGKDRTTIQRTVKRIQEKATEKGFVPTQVVASDPLSLEWIPQGLTPEGMEEWERKLGIKDGNERLIFEYYALNGKNGSYRFVAENLNIALPSVKVSTKRICEKARKKGIIK